MSGAALSPGAARSLAEALRRLRRGELVVHPTESVYGFGGFLDDAPLASLRRLKGRAEGGFVVLIPSPRAVAGLLCKTGAALAEAFWPGPLTLVLDDPADRFDPRAKAPDGSVAVRVPGHPLALRLLRECGRAITSTSANRPGTPPARTAPAALEAARALGADLFALDAGPLRGAPVSTLVRAGPGPPALIRPGAVDALDLSRAAGAPIGPGAAAGSTGTIRDAGIST